MNDLVKVAYGIGVIGQLNELGIDPKEFVKTAAQSTDQDMRVAADSILCVERYANEDPAGTEKVAALIREPKQAPSLMDRLGLS